MLVSILCRIHTLAVLVSNGLAFLLCQLDKVSIVTYGASAWGYSQAFSSMSVNLVFPQQEQNTPDGSYQGFSLGL